MRDHVVCEKAKVDRTKTESAKKRIRKMLGRNKATSKDGGVCAGVIQQQFSANSQYTKVLACRIPQRS